MKICNLYEIPPVIQCFTDNYDIQSVPVYTPDTCFRYSGMRNPLCACNDTKDDHLHNLQPARGTVSSTRYSNRDVQSIPVQLTMIVIMAIIHFERDAKGLVLVNASRLVCT